MEATTQIIRFMPRPRKGALARLGDAMQRHRRAILALQWSVAVFYAALVVVPVFMPLPQTGATIFSNLILFAQFAFWGIWWPFVILSIMLLGRVWCGVLCPEGALAEFASHHGRGGTIPKWIRWSGWPVLAFILTTIYGQLISVYDYPQAALLILGGSTVAAVAVGWLYGKGSGSGAAICARCPACSPCWRGSPPSIFASTANRGSVTRAVPVRWIARRCWA